jgi:creatinine amidohydrolase
MRFENMMLRDIKAAKAERTPIVIPVGTIEYHGPHCSLGCDTQICLGLLSELEKRKNIIIAPPVWYGVASFAVGGPENGTVNVDVDIFEAYIYQILKSLLYGGFKNIYMLIHHQYETENLMPMTLACMKAAKKLVFEYLEETRGRGWWGSNDFATYYEALESSDNPFNWITVLPAMSAEVQKATGYDHAGKFECSILKALYPDAVKTERIPESDAWFIQSAAESSVELGLKMVELSVEDLYNKIN